MRGCSALVRGLQCRADADRAALSKRSIGWHPEAAAQLMPAASPPNAAATSAYAAQRTDCEMHLHNGSATGLPLNDAPQMRRDYSACQSTAPATCRHSLT